MIIGLSFSACELYRWPLFSDPIRHNLMYIYAASAWHMPANTCTAISHDRLMRRQMIIYNSRVPYVRALP